MPRSLPIEWVTAECANALGDRFRHSAQADAASLSGIDRGIVFVFHNSGTPRLALRRLVDLIVTEDPSLRLSFTLVPIAGSARLLSLPVFASTYRDYGVVLWVQGGQVLAYTPVTGMSEEVWVANTRLLLSAGT